MKVYLGGVFDLFHIGHLSILERAKALGDHLTVGVLTDEAAMAYKDTPVIPFEERILIVRGLACVDEVVRQEDTNPCRFGELQEIDPDILVHGDEWDKLPGQDWMAAHGRKTIFLPHTKGITTTILKQKIKEGR